MGGYPEDWQYHATYSGVPQGGVPQGGVPQGGVVSPILSNLVLDRLDRYVEYELIPVILTTRIGPFRY